MQDVRHDVTLQYSGTWTLKLREHGDEMAALAKLSLVRIHFMTFTIGAVYGLVDI